MGFNYKTLDMSTRTNIEFIDENGDKILLYQHSDGYIEGMIPEFVEFFKWHGKPYDLEYSTANFVYFAKRYIEDWSISHQKQKNKEKGINQKVDWKHEDVAYEVQLGHGICQPEQLHGDIEYFYRIHVNVGNEKPIKVEVWESRKWDNEYKDLVSSKPTVTFTFDPKTFKIQNMTGEIKRPDVKKVAKEIGFIALEPQGIEIDAKGWVS